jgi:hypothetical protein
MSTSIRNRRNWAALLHVRAAATKPPRIRFFHDRKPMDFLRAN